MTTPVTPPAKEARNLWEKYPWAGFLLFLGIMAAVGGFLAWSVGERPHHRRDEWRVFTEVPPPGSGLAGGPSMGEMAAGFRDRIVHNWVIVTVEDARARPLGHREVALVRGSQDELLATGITEPVGGRVRIPVPPLAEPDYYRGEVRAVLLSPHEPARVLDVPAPSKGKSAVTFQATKTALADVNVRSLSVDKLQDRNTRVRVARTNGTFDPRSAGWRVVNQKARIGGLPPGKSVKISVAAPGREVVLRTFELPAAGKSATVVLTAGKRLARLRVRVQRADGKDLADETPLRMTSRTLRDGKQVTLSKDLVVNGGAIRCEIPSGLSVRVTLRTPEGRLASHTLPVVLPDADLTCAPLTLAARVLAKGRVEDTQGRGVEGAALSLFARRDGQPIVLRTRSQEDGSFTFSDAPLDAIIAIGARSEALVGYRVPTEAAEGTRIRLQNAGGVKGTILAKETVLQRTVNVTLWRDGARILRRPVAWRRDRGEFVIKDLAPGIYTLRVNAALQPSRSVPVTIASDKITEVNEVALEPVTPGELTVRHAGGPAADARVSVRGEGIVTFEATTGPFGRVLVPSPDSRPAVRLEATAKEGHAEDNAQSFPRVLQLTPYDHATLLAGAALTRFRDQWVLVALKDSGGTLTPWRVLRPGLRLRFSDLRAGAYTVVGQTISKTYPTQRGPVVPLMSVDTTQKKDLHNVTENALAALQK